MSSAEVSKSVDTYKMRIIEFGNARSERRVKSVTKDKEI